jgi:hypothetical protein
MFGDQISTVALPLVAVLTLRAGAAQMGFLAAVVWLPSLLFGLHAGALADRRGHWRAMMIAADLGRAVLLISIPVCYAFGVLTIWQLYGVGLGVGSLSVLFTVCQPTLISLPSTPVRPVGVTVCGRLTIQPDVPTSVGRHGLLIWRPRPGLPRADGRDHPAPAPQAAWGGPVSCSVRWPLGLVAMVVPSALRCSVQPQRWITIK